MLLISDSPCGWTADLRQVEPQMRANWSAALALLKLKQVWHLHGSTCAQQPCLPGTLVRLLRVGLLVTDKSQFQTRCQTGQSDRYPRHVVPDEPDSRPLQYLYPVDS